MRMQELWETVGRPLLQKLPRLKAVLEEQLETRAAEPDGALNTLVRSLCGESLFHQRWEHILSWFSADVWRESLGSLLQQTGTLGITFDRRLDDAWAELEALNTFVRYATDLEI